MKNVLALTSITLIGLFVSIGNHEASALSYTDIQGTSADAVITSSYSTTSYSSTISVDPNYSSEINTTDATLSASAYPTISSTTNTTLSVENNTTVPTSTSGDLLVISAYPSQTISTSSTPINTTTTQPVDAQSDTTTSTSNDLQSTYYFGPPQLISSNPAGGGAISGSAYNFSATISDPNNLVHNVRFVLYDMNGNIVLDSDSTMNGEGVWVADKPFDSTGYPDGYGYTLEITSEGDSGSPDIRYTLSWDSVYFGIDNIKSNEVTTYPDVGGNTLINKTFVATAYYSYSTGEIPVTSASVQFYFVDSQGSRTPQGDEVTMTRDSDPYFGLWSTASIDSKTSFTAGNGHYIAVFNSVYEDGATTSTEAAFEVYNFDDVTAPSKPIIVSPANGITMAPGSITYSWIGNEGDDIVGVNFERGEIDPDTGTFEGRAGGYQDIRDGSFSWTESSDYVPAVAYTVNWRIQVRDRAGNWSEWSDVSSYTIDPNYVPDTTPPPQPILLSPANNQNVNNSKVIQSWRSDANDIDYYIYESYNDPQRKNVVTQEKVSTNTRTTINHANGAYWWRIQAVDKSGNKSEWSSLSKMTISNKK